MYYEDRDSYVENEIKDYDLTWLDGPKTIFAREKFAEEPLYYTLLGSTECKFFCELNPGGDIKFKSDQLWINVEQFFKESDFTPPEPETINWQQSFPIYVYVKSMHIPDKYWNNDTYWRDFGPSEFVTTDYRSPPEQYYRFWDIELIEYIYKWKKYNQLYEPKIFIHPIGKIAGRKARLIARLLIHETVQNNTQEVNDTPTRENILLYVKRF
jgi:hypothetical protein